MALSKRPAAGFSLVEVLVSIVVLSLGLLGVVGMLTTSVRSTSESGAFTAAVNLVRGLSEKARINKDLAVRRGSSTEPNPYLIDVDVNSADAAKPNTCVGTGAVCNAKQLAAWDVHEWVIRVRETLPEAHVVICFDDAPTDDAKDDEYTWDCSKEGRNLVVKLGWVPRMGSKEEMGADRPPRVVMQLIPGHDYVGSEMS